MKLMNKCLIFAASFLMVGSTASADNCCGTFGFHADYLYWDTCSSGHYVAAEYTRETDTANYNFIFDKAITKRRVKTLDDCADSGFRIGAWYQPCCGCWDLAVNWTYFKPDSSRKVKGDPFSILTPFSGLGLFNDLSSIITLGYFTFLNADEVKSSYNLSYNVVDLELGFNTCFNDCIHFRPHASLRFASFDQELTIKSEGEITEIYNILLIEDTLGRFRSKEDFCHDFCGVGPRIGFDFDWEIGCGIGVYGDLAAAMLYGNRDLSDKAHAERFDTEFTGNVSMDFFERTKLDKHCIRAMTDLGVGLYWSKEWCGCANTTLKLGWEHHYVFNQGLTGASVSRTFLTSTQDNFYTHDDNDLAVHGLTVALGLDF